MSKHNVAFIIRVATTNLLTFLRSGSICPPTILQLFLDGKGDCLEHNWPSHSGSQGRYPQQLAAAFEGDTRQEHLTFCR